MVGEFKKYQDNKKDLFQGHLQLLKVSWHMKKYLEILFENWQKKKVNWILTTLFNFWS